jgi:formate C-acetyltransferase
MTDHELFLSINEPFAAGLFEDADASLMIRYAKAYKAFFEMADITPYESGRLYPSGVNSCYNGKYAVRPHNSNGFEVNFNALRQKSERAYELMKREYDLVVKFYDSPHCVGGMGWTHSFPNYSRILREGLNTYSARVDALPDGDFKESMKILLDAIRIYHSRCLEQLGEQNAPSEIIDALERVPFSAPKNLYEALLSINFIYYVDGCDDIGPIDKNLYAYYSGEPIDELEELLREFFSNVDVNNGWSGTLGPDYNEVTRAAIRAIKGGRRPNLQLLVRRDMPSWVWEECAVSLASSCGQPALYNCDLYKDGLRRLMPNISESDIDRIAFGGCTETMFEGLSCVGSDDAGINTALIFSDYMRRELVSAESFEDFYNGFIGYFREVFGAVIARLNEYRRTRALYRPALVRTLLVDDCLDMLTEFNAGGARYVYSLINIAGAINVIDSLCVLRELIYEKKKYSAGELLELMDARDPEFLRSAKSCISYGNDNDRADEMGARLVADIVASFKGHECYPRGSFYPVANQFTTYVDAGKSIPATPDGRAAGEPLCDSLGAIHNNDHKGATALLNSVAKLDVRKIIGTPTTNIRLSREQVAVALPALVNAFFERGGMQLQVSCLSREDILDAMAHPEKHASLAVRIGGYSEYFNRLSPELKQTVLERTEH